MNDDKVKLDQILSFHVIDILKEGPTTSSQIAAEILAGEINWDKPKAEIVAEIAKRYYDVRTSVGEIIAGFMEKGVIKRQKDVGLVIKTDEPEDKIKNE